MKHIAIICIVAVAAVAGACSEHLNGGAACPALCPGQDLQVTDTTFRVDRDNVLLDTTVASYPLLGEELTLLVANIPGRADVRGVIRFDSVQNFYSRKAPSGNDSSFTVDTVRNAAVWFLIDAPSVRATRGADLVQLRIFSIDSAGTDTVVSSLTPLFRNDRLIGSSRPIAASLLGDTAGARTLDTMLVPLDTGIVHQVLKSSRRNLRLGFQAVVASSPTDGVRLTINYAVTLPFVRFFTSDSSTKDTTFGRVSVTPRSATPVADSGLLARLIHYPLFVQGAITDSTDALNIGGAPARRVYLQFRLPSRIVDSANIVRATLLLTPRPLPPQLPGDTAVIYPQPVVSSSKVMDPAAAANFAVSSSLYGLDSVKDVPTSAAKVAAFDFVNAAKQWQNVSDTLNTRALVLRILSEGATTLETSYWSSSAADTSKRPHVRLQFVRRTKFALP